MKIAVLADIHANLPALQAVIEHIESWQPDQVIVAGDTVNRGPRPAECLALIQAKQRTEGWLVVRGNHEDYVISRAAPDAPRQGAAFEVHLPSYWTYQKLGCNVTPLLEMPLEQRVALPRGEELRAVHGSLLGMRDGIYPGTSDAALPAKIMERGQTVPPALFCVGHTHLPLVRHWKGALIVNAGSVGLPFDRDTRTGYAQITSSRSGWKAEIVRFSYDFLQARQDFITTGYLAEGGPLIQIVQIELEQAEAHLYNWAIQFQEPALRGEITMSETVEAYLDQLEL